MKKQVLGILAALFVCAVLLPVGVRATDADAANVYAILYDDGTLVFQHGNTPEPGKTVRNTYEVDLTAVYTGYPSWYNERESVRVVDFAGRISPTSTAYWFYGCSNLERMDNIRNLDTANVTSMSFMFYDCRGLTVLDVSHLNTANVTSMSYMFYGCSDLMTLDISHFDTAKVADMRLMFYECHNLGIIYASDSFTTASVPESEYNYSRDMFNYCVALVGGNGTRYNNSHTDKEYARIDTASAPGYFTAKPTPYAAHAILYDDGTLVFQHSNTPESGRTVTNMYAVDLNNAYKPWYNERESVRTVNFADRFSPTSTAYWFSGCSNLERVDNIQNLDTANVTSMRYMFSGCSALTVLDVSHFDTANVTNMYGMFFRCRELTELDVSHFDTANVTDMSWMFGYCTNLMALDVSNFNTANVRYIAAMFDSCSSLTALDVSHFDTANVMLMYQMFYGCSGLRTLDVSHFNTANVTDISHMFGYCSRLTALDVSHFDTTNVTRMLCVFFHCSALTTLDVSQFDTANVASMYRMFEECFNLKTIYTSDKFTTASVTDSMWMFKDCISLIGGNGTEYDENHINKTYARIDTPSAPGYFTAKGTTPVTYTVTWRNYDGAVLRTDTSVVAGTVPTYDGEAPVRTGYRFTGWSPQPSAVTGDVTYTAQFEEVEQLFDVRRDAYAFGNSMQDFGYTSRGGPGGGRYPIPAQSFFVIFGENMRAKVLYEMKRSKAWDGNCAGMASSAALLFAYGQLNPADFGKSNTYSLAIGDKNAEMSVLTLVEALQIAQFTDAFGQAQQANQVTSGQSLNGLYQTIKDEIGQGRPTLLAIAKEHVGGHALLAVGADDDENRILIYDCNHPGELRYMTLSADRTAWSYDMGGYGVWGSDSGACSISYVPYAVLEDIWANRGNLRQTSQVLTVNAENVSITNFDGDTVASLENGQLVTSTEGVYELVDLSMYWPEERSICLPRNEVYTVSTSDDITLSASMTDSHMSAEITTSAHTVTFGVSDDEKENSVVVQGATASDTYSITLESDFDDLRHKNLTLTGTGQGENVNVSMTQDGVTFVNCNIESLSLDACKIVSAARGRDGKLSVTLTNPNGAVLAVSYFDADGKFMSAALQAVAADAGTVSVDIPADATAARVMLFDTDCRPLCAAREADFSGGAG